MKRFRFRFEAVERVRKAKEQEALKALGSAQQAHSSAVQHKFSILEKMAESLTRRDDIASSTTGPILSIQMETIFIEGSRHRLILAEQSIIRAKRNVEKALRVYLYARRQLRMIENLREKAFAEFKKEMNKREQKQIDELNTLRARLNHDRRMGLIDGEEVSQEASA
ncbi:MAG: flagellar export protein FliJ [Bdellovibrionales bacterium]|nr:flagellar export protein FliJ [Bdellovibrionales bacterium]